MLKLLLQIDVLTTHLYLDLYYYIPKDKWNNIKLRGYNLGYLLPQYRNFQTMNKSKNIDVCAIYQATHKYNEDHIENSNKIIKILKGINGFISLKFFYRYFKNTIRNNELSLKKLKNPSHPCSNDFMLIFNHLENKSNSFN